MNKENSDTYSVTCRCPRLLVFVLAAALVFGAVCVGGVSGADGNWDGTSSNTEWLGSGTESDPYLITSAADLKGLANQVNNGNNYSGDYFKLTTDIDLAGKEWTPIGYRSINKVNKGTVTPSKDNNDIRAFSGTFNGNGHSISNLYIVAGSGSTYGLFGYVKGGKICNLNLDGDFTKDGERGSCILKLNNGNNVAGSLVGWLDGGSVYSCSVHEYGVIVPTSNNGQGLIFGGLIGYITGSNGAAISADKINQYIEGSSSVIVVNTSYNKENNWGLLVGSPNAGNYVEPGDSGESDNSGSTDDHTSTVYVVNIYEMKDGNYNTSSPSSRSEYVALVGSTVTAYYSLSEGYTLDESKSPESSLTKKIEREDTKIVFNVFLRNVYELTFISDGATLSSSNVLYGLPVSMIPNPEKPGYRYTWSPAVPNTMPAKDLIITAVWEYINPIFTITIPEDIPLDNTTLDGSKYVGVDITQLSDIGNLSITVSSANSYRLVLKNHPDISLNYNLFIDGSSSPAVQDGLVGSFKGPVLTQILMFIPIRVEVNETPRYSGSYSDTLTFTVKYTETN